MGNTDSKVNFFSKTREAVIELIKFTQPRKVLYKYETVLVILNCIFQKWNLMGPPVDTVLLEASLSSKCWP
jgi:hypothetical protein